MNNRKKISFINRLIKRLFDIIFSLFILFTIFPLLFIIVVIANLISCHCFPIFFRQKRTGLHGKTFYCYKFRSMIVNKNSDREQAGINDPRVTKFGKILRKYSLDEIPQFLNVLIGDMSVVGPRPHMLRHTVKYSSLIHNYMIRHAVKPGITGYAQIKGLRGETKEFYKMQLRVEKDLWYVENYSFWLDLKIVFFTPMGMRSEV